MTMFISLGIIAGSLGHYNKCPNPILLGRVRKSHTDTCLQTVGGGTVTVETSPAAPGTLSSVVVPPPPQKRDELELKLT